jgi:hypothetical protein
MRVLFIGLLAVTLVGCATVAQDESAVRTPTASKVDAKPAKSIRARKAKVVAKAKHAGLTTASRATQPRGTDPVTEKAQAAIAAMLPEPASAEFYDLKRSQKQLLHKTVDTICGYVRAKKGSGGDARGMPFLYTVDDGQAYLVNGRSEVSATVHGALCK